jgi:hypothetical protein
MRIILVILIALMSFSVRAESDHPIHISVAEWRYNAERNTLECAIKLFTDDLELVLTTRNGESSWNLATDDQIPNADRYIYDYLSKTVRVSQDNTQLTMKWVGAEYNIDAVWCYFEILEFNASTQFEFTNSAFLEVYPDQSNVNHFYVGEESSSFVTNKDDREKIIKLINE